MVNEQVMITLCSAVGCGIAIVVLSLFVALARKVAAHHKHKAEVKAEAKADAKAEAKEEAKAEAKAEAKEEAKAEALKEKEDDKKAESADVD